MKSLHCFDELFNTGFWIIDMSVQVSSQYGQGKGDLEWWLKDLNAFITEFTSRCHLELQPMEFPVENCAASPHCIIMVQRLVVMQMQFVLTVDCINILLEHCAQNIKEFLFSSIVWVHFWIIIFFQRLRGLKKDNIKNVKYIIVKNTDIQSTLLCPLILLAPSIWEIFELGAMQGNTYLGVDIEIC